MWFRAYFNKTKGNEHSRVHDFEAADVDAAQRAADKAAKKDETLDQIVSLAGPPEGS